MQGCGEVRPDRHSAPTHAQQPGWRPLEDRVVAHGVRTMKRRVASWGIGHSSRWQRQVPVPHVRHRRSRRSGDRPPARMTVPARVNSPRAPLGSAGGLYVRASPPRLGVHHVDDAPAAIDPGDLSDWPGLTWRTESGTVPMTTDPAQGHRAVLLDTLAAKAQRWMLPRVHPEAAAVVIDDPRLIRRWDAVARSCRPGRRATTRAPSDERRVPYDGPDLRSLIVERVRALGPGAFADSDGVPRDTAGSWAIGLKLPSATWVKRLLPLLGTEARLCAWRGATSPSRGRTRPTAPAPTTHRAAGWRRSATTRPERGAMTEHAAPRTERASARVVLGNEGPF
jgi:hypothetical protein